jgi:hypothetical protein
MNLSEVVGTVKSLQFPDGNYVVYGSGPLALHGIRDVNDVDLLVTKELKAELKASGWKEINKGPNDTPVTKGNVEAHDTWSFCEYNPTLDELLSRADIYEGVAFASLEDVLKWKLASSASDKNLKDIEIIKAKLSENRSA